MSEEKTEEQKLRSKRVHALVMMVLGAIMAVCALAAGLIASVAGLPAMFGVSAATALSGAGITWLAVGRPVPWGRVAALA